VDNVEVPRWARDAGSGGGERKEFLEPGPGMEEFYQS
jgi:hypothetical protein